METDDAAGTGGKHGRVGNGAKFREQERTGEGAMAKNEKGKKKREEGKGEREETTEARARETARARSGRKTPARGSLRRPSCATHPALGECPTDQFVFTKPKPQGLCQAAGA